MEENIQAESVVKKVLTKEVKFIIVIITFIVGIVAPYYQIRQDIALIKQNALFHIEKQQEQIKDLNTKYTDLKETQIEVQKQIIELIKEFAKK